MSDAVCTGLQLVNFLQDPPRDLALGRVYLPQEDLRRFRSSRTSSPARALSAPVALLASRQRGRARFSSRGFRSQRAGRASGRSVALFARGGLAALDALERAGWDVFTGRPAPRALDFRPSGRSTSCPP